MATVRVSEKLKNDMRAKVAGMQNVATQALGPEPAISREFSTFPDERKEALLNMLWGPHNHLRAQIPEVWKSEIRYLELRCEGHPTGKRTLHINSVKGVFPVSDSYRMRVKVDLSTLTPAYNWITEWCEARADYEFKKKAVEVEHNSIRDQVISFIESYSTLNTAAKKWAGIKLYVPKEYLDTLERKVERNSSKEDIEEEHSDIDFAALAAAGAAARMSGG